ncbi:hypothetical protein ABEX00_16475 [Bacillus safensis]
MGAEKRLQLDRENKQVYQGYLRQGNHLLCNGNLRDDLFQGAETGERIASMPLYTKDSNGNIGMVMRQCTKES